MYKITEELSTFKRKRKEKIPNFDREITGGKSIWRTNKRNDGNSHTRQQYNIISILVEQYKLLFY
jgi:hypothetical protein